MSDAVFNCDWGTTRFRLRLLDARTRSIICERRTDEGVGSLSLGDVASRAERFRAVLAAHVEGISAEIDLEVSRSPVLISGMASSSIGWRDLPYAQLPFSLNGRDLSYAMLEQEATQLTQPVVLFSGVRGESEVMRGEEVELMGLGVLAQELLDQSEMVWVVLPGTHSKHVRISGNAMTEFHTHMTGEVFYLLSEQSSLRHPGRAAAAASSLSAPSAEWRDAFVWGVELVRECGLSASLFQVRARQVLHGYDAAQSAGLLSGLLIGDEVQSLTQHRAPEGPIVLAASAELCEPYRMAFGLLDMTHRLTVIPPSDVASLSAWGQYVAWQRVAADLQK